jgi:hypothetical protein
MPRLFTDLFHLVTLDFEYWKYRKFFLVGDKKHFEISELLNLKCPICSGAVELNFKSDGLVYAVSCPTDSTHLHITQETETPPEGFQKFISQHWLC